MRKNKGEQKSAFFFIIIFLKGEKRSSLSAFKTVRSLGRAVREAKKTMSKS